MAYYISDLSLLKTVNTWNILFAGIHVVYQRQERRFGGNSDPHNREAIWLSGYFSNATLSVLKKFLNGWIYARSFGLICRISKSVINRDEEYVTTSSDTLYTDYETVVFMKKRKSWWYYQIPDHKEINMRLLFQRKVIWQRQRNRIHRYYDLQ